MTDRNGQPRIWGYARASRNHQVKSPEVQLSLIHEKAQTIQGADWARCRTDAATSATETRWNERPEFVKLMDEMEPGDHLIIWRFDRLERSPFAMVHALEWLVNRGVAVHVLEFGGMQLDLETPQGRMLAMIMATFAGFFADQLSEAIKAGKAWRKERGLAYHRWPPPGKTRVRRRAGGKKIIEDVWDQTQCDLIAEVKRRKDAHETMGSIARDFEAREEKLWNGKPWSHAYGKQKRRNLYRFYKAYWFYTALLAEGKDLMGVPATPEDQERAKRQMARKEKMRYGVEQFEPWEKYVGVEEAAEMIEQATSLNKGGSNAYLGRTES